MGNHVDLQDYGLLSAFQNFPSAISKIKEFLSNNKLKAKWRRRRDLMLKDKISVTDFVVDIIDRYPTSLKNIRNNL